MKELSIEEKAKRYDEAIKKLRSLHDNYDTVSTLIDVKEELEDIFPELKESEDERMIRYFKDLAPFDKAEELYEKYGFSHKDAIAWLEKQSEHANFINKIQIGDKVTRNEDGVLVNLSQLNRVAKKDEKQGEQKPADETKFKVGDWVVYCNDDVDLITGIEENGYCINNGGYIPFVCESDIRLWTIEDAKDGDVLVASDGSIFIFKGTIDCACKHYVALTTDDVVNFNEGLEHYWETSTAVHPATKKQRDLLFQKMHEAGYEWDADKKELKKIEQKPTWSEEDEEIYRKCICAMRASACGFPEEEKFVEQVDNWFKSLKDRVQPKQEWSNWDKTIIESIEALCDEKIESIVYQDIKEHANDIKEWLKSLKDRYTWRPSEEQMDNK